MPLIYLLKFIPYSDIRTLDINGQIMTDNEHMHSPRQIHGRKQLAFKQTIAFGCSMLHNMKMFIEQDAASAVRKACPIAPDTQKLCSDTQNLVKLNRM